MELFPVLPESFDGLSNDEILALLADSQAAAASLAAGDVDTGDMTPQQILDAMTAGVDGIERLKGEIKTREEAAAEFEAKMAAEAARASAGDDDGETGDETPAADTDADGDKGEEPEAKDDGDKADDDGDKADDPEPAVEPEAAADGDAAADTLPIAASAAKPKARRALPRAGQRHTRAVEPKRQLATITAAADIPGVPMGAKLDGIEGIAKAMQARFRGLGSSSVRGEQVPVATIHANYPEERHLIYGDRDGNRRKVDAVIAPEAILASGGLCAPVTPYYGVDNVSVADRPVRAALAGFNADRGGITFAPPPLIGDMANAVTVISASDDASGGSAATKSCLDVSCPQFTEVDVAIIAHCNIFHNLTARAWPEQVENALALTMAMHSRVAETALLDAIETGSSAVTGPAIGSDVGISAGFIEQVTRAAAAYRNRHRMRPDATLRALAPAWLRDAMVADMVLTQFYREGAAPAAIDEDLRIAGVNMSWFLDGTTSGNNVFGAQSDGQALDAWPSTVEWFLFNEGGWLHLDGGALELGLVRDSVQNAVNEYQMFGEIFEAAAFVGVESLAITTDLCVTGTTSGPIDGGISCAS